MRAAIGFIGAAGTLHDRRRLAAGSPQPDESTEWARAQDRGSDRNLTRRPGPADDAGQHGRETMHATGRGDCLGRLHARTITAGRRHSTA
jgi:hypothetical protein